MATVERWRSRWKRRRPGGVSESQFFTPVGTDSLLYFADGASSRAVWTKGIGGSGDQVAQTVSFDEDGSVLVTGRTSGTTLTVDGVLVAQDSAVATRPFALRFSAKEPHAVTFASTIAVAPADGQALVFGGRSLSSGDVVVCGSLTGVTTFANESFAQPGGADVFIARLTKDGSVVWHKEAGGASADDCAGLAVDSNDNIVVLVNHQSGAMTFDGVALAEPGSAGFTAGAVLKLDPNGKLVWHHDLGGGHVRLQGVAVAPNDDVLYGGYFRGTLDLGDGPRTVEPGKFSPFVVRRTR